MKQFANNAGSYAELTHSRLGTFQTHLERDGVTVSWWAAGPLVDKIGLFALNVTYLVALYSC